MRSMLALVPAALLLASATMAMAKNVEYRATLNGQSETISTGSKARGTAVVQIDMAAKTVSVRLDVTGMKIDALWDDLVKAPVGPIHFHQYASGNLADAGSSTLAFPLTFGPSYRPTRKGFSVRTGPIHYASAVAPLGETASFEAFVSALDKSIVVLNIHTDAHSGGEVNGVVKRVGPS